MREREGERNWFLNTVEVSTERFRGGPCGTDVIASRKIVLLKTSRAISPGERGEEAFGIAGDKDAAILRDLRE